MGLQPATELFSLSDYRKRHALYRHAAGLYCCLETCTAAVAGAVVLRGGSCHTALAPASIGNMGVLPFVCFSAGRTLACKPCLPLHPSYPHGMITVRGKCSRHHHHRLSAPCQGRGPAYYNCCKPVHIPDPSSASHLPLAEVANDAWTDGAENHQPNGAKPAAAWGCLAVLLWVVASCASDTVCA